MSILKLSYRSLLAAVVLVSGVMQPMIAAKSEGERSPKWNTGPWDVTQLKKAPEFRETEIAATVGYKSLFYKALPYKGQETEVYAYYSAPAGEAPEGGWPAVVLVHGGGGTAFVQWIKRWNNQGFAAIAMDLEGHIPSAKPHNERDLFATSGPQRVGVFHDWKEDVSNQWFYHAVSQVLLAHSLMADFEEVNADQIGVVGVSWGGILTSVVAGIDDRVKFAVPIYGCGFLPESDGHMGKALATGGAYLQNVETNYEPSIYLSQAVAPMLFISGTNDAHFPPPIVVRSANAAQNGHAIIALNMKHGHGPGWSRMESYAFAKEVINGESPDFGLGNLTMSGDGLSLTISIDPKRLSKAAHAKFYFTRDASNKWPDKKWEERDILLATDLVIDLPNQLQAGYLTLTDDQGLASTSEVLFLGK
ncbi:acetylxylan esterase [Reichenbachiella carrageenanivorans]|uniref:Acetylxylan esterase n=1 Tax=Reichenbachiella carrageenanivorans TaxID=2979869 RepID=A0ABY6D402_9BACT|nr:acetylxylan esterase [Reichenbachiella carrageenanivorans]UXX79848.1 acetylxylan esterase [Reichenbachiella carrageenanivorans]